MQKSLKGRFAWGYTIIFATSCVAEQSSLSFSLREYEKLHDSPIVYVFCHGLGATQKQGTLLYSRIREKNKDGSYIANHHWIIDEPLGLFNFPDAKNDNNEYMAHEVNLGQQKDMAQLKEALQEIDKVKPGNQKVLMGVSRGASVILNLEGLDPDPSVVALVVESPFDCLKSIIKHLLKRYVIDWFPFSVRIGLKIAQSQFPELKIDGIFPHKTVQFIPHTLPIMIIHSKKDKVVPIKCSRKLYMQLRQTGHHHVYLLELPEGLHGKLMNGPDATMYQNVVHAFYKRYNLPHQAHFAAQGEHLLNLCQPSIPEVKLRNKRSEIEEESADR